MLPGRVGGVDGAAAVVDGTDRRATGGEGGRSGEKNKKKINSQRD